MGSSYGYDLAVCLCVSGPLPLEEQTCRRPDVMVPWLPKAVQAVIFVGRQRLAATFFLDPSIFSPFSFQEDPVPVPRLILSVRASPVGSTPSA